MKQTAVETLIEIYYGNEGQLTIKDLEQAKEMEKAEKAKQDISLLKNKQMKYLVIFIMSLIIEIASTFYISYVSEKNAIGMLIFAFIGPFLSLPFVGYVVDSKDWNERIWMAFAAGFGYVSGSLIVIKIIY